MPISDDQPALPYASWRFYDPNSGRYLTPDPLSPLVPADNILSGLGLPVTASTCRGPAGGRRYARRTWVGRSRLAKPVRFGDPNPFAYAGNNPLRFLDTFGLRREACLARAYIDSAASLGLGDVCNAACGASLGEGLGLVGAIEFCNDPAVFSPQKCIVECIYADECHPDDDLHDIFSGNALAGGG